MIWTKANFENQALTSNPGRPRLRGQPVPAKRAGQHFGMLRGLRGTGPCDLASMNPWPENLSFFLNFGRRQNAQFSGDISLFVGDVTWFLGVPDDSKDDCSTSLGAVTPKCSRQDDNVMVAQHFFALRLNSANDTLAVLQERRSRDTRTRGWVPMAILVCNWMISQWMVIPRHPWDQWLCIQYGLLLCQKAVDDRRSVWTVEGPWDSRTAYQNESSN